MRLLLAALCLGAAGCAAVPFAGTHSSGERLDVITEKGPNLRSHPIPVFHDATYWYPAQGASAVDEEAFYRIAGQPAVAQQVHEIREGLVTQQTAGAWLLGAGAAVFVGGGATAISADEIRIHNHNHHGTGVIFSSVISAGVGFLSMLAGGAAIEFANMRMEDHILGYEQAVDAANQYNLGVERAGH